MKTLHAIFIGGGSGCVARCGINGISVLVFGNIILPLCTLTANVVSSALAAILEVILIYFIPKQST